MAEAEQKGTKKTSGEDRSAEESGEVATKATDKSRSRLPRIIILAVILVGIAGALIWYFFIRKPAVPSNLIEVSGRIETDDSSVAAKTSGRIKEITVREGDTVTAGQTIATLDDDQVRAREDQAQAVVEQTVTRIARAQEQIAVLQEQLGQSEIGTEQSKTDAQGRVSQAEALVLQAEALLAQAEANYSQARYDEEKNTRLFKTGDVSEHQMKQAQTNAEAQLKVVQAQRKQVDSARGALTTAKANLANPSIRLSQTAAIKKQIQQAHADIDSANADAERARAQLREAEANRADLNIIAPFSGIVSTRSAEPGEVVTPGAVIITLLNPNVIYLRAFVAEGDIGKVRVGQAARVYIDADPTNPIEAEVSRIDPEATFTPENTYFRDERVKQVVGVKLQIKTPQGFAKPGMPADGEILVDGSWASNKRQTTLQ